MKIWGSAVPSLLQRLFFRKNRRGLRIVCALYLSGARALCPSARKLKSGVGVQGNAIGCLVVVGL